MSEETQKPFKTAPWVLLPMATGFIAVGLSGQPAFGYIGLGFLIPGVVLTAINFCSKRKPA